MIVDGLRQADHGKRRTSPRSTLSDGAVRGLVDLAASATRSSERASRASAGAPELLGTCRRSPSASW